MKSINVAIQGGRASFHHIAVHTYFDGVVDADVLECQSFQMVIDRLVSGEADYAFMAIENTIAGDILPNYKLIEQSSVKIIGEYWLWIVQNLMALPGQRIEDLAVVQSHYMALDQCRPFLAQYPHWQVKVHYDTADSAKEIRENNLVNVASIAGDLAAKEYGLTILAPAINADKNNRTRFLILSRDTSNPFDALINKATVAFTLTDKVGSLLKITNAISHHGLNMSKILSVQQELDDNTHRFYVDVMFESIDSFNTCFEEICNYSSSARCLGQYHHHDIKK